MKAFLQRFARGLRKFQGASHENVRWRLPEKRLFEKVSTPPRTATSQ